VPETERTFVLIMAGGGGTRLWPASRRRRPKQFLPLLPGGQTLLGSTVERLSPLVPPERMLVVTAANQVADVQRAASAVRFDNIVAEPMARNTAACIGLGAVEVLRRDPEALVAVIPSDQFVAEPEPYREALSRALAVAARGGVVTVGIRPTAPETGFGYIKLGPTVEGGAHVVDRFVEKPDRATAEEYLLSRDYLWNSGMFFFRASHILEAIHRHLPKLGEILDTIRADPATVGSLYPMAPSTSIDYGVMERLGPGEVFVVPGSFGWNDVGSWSALGEIAAHDEADNTVLGDAVTVDARGNILVTGPERLIAAVGVSDLVIVSTEDAVLVMPKERAQDVREVVRALETKKKETYL
jgi:mannose-1-phosphate guanylyltransferase